MTRHGCHRQTTHAVNQRRVDRHRLRRQPHRGREPDTLVSWPETSAPAAAESPAETIEDSRPPSALPLSDTSAASNIGRQAGTPGSSRAGERRLKHARLVRRQRHQRLGRVHHRDRW